MATGKAGSLDKIAFQNCARIFTQICKGKETRIVWELDNWRNNLQIYKSHATCTMQLDKMFLRFSFRENSKKEFQESCWLSLQICGVPLPSSPDEPPIVQPAFFKVEVDPLSEDLELDYSFYKSTETNIALFTDKPVLVDEHFIQLSDRSINPDSMPVRHPNRLRLGITVTELHSISKQTPPTKPAEEIAAISESDFSEKILQIILALSRGPPERVQSSDTSDSKRVGKFNQSKQDFKNLFEFGPPDDKRETLTKEETSSEPPAAPICDPNEHVFEMSCDWKDCELRLLQIWTYPELVKHVHLEHIHDRNSSLICKWKDCPREEKPCEDKYTLIVHMREHTNVMCETCNVRFCSV